MGKDTAAEPLMAVPELKLLLAKARRGDPVSCAVALGKDKQAILLLDRKKKPRKLAAELRRKAADAGLEPAAATLRFGRAEVDGAEDAGTVTFVVNKEPPGALRPKLVALLRPAGFGHVEFTVDEGLDADQDDEHPAAVLKDDDGDGDDEAAPLQAPLAALLRLVPAVIGAEPERREELLGLAAAAADAVKAGAGEIEMERLRLAVEAGGPPPDPALEALLSAVGKSAQVWDATLRQVGKQVSELHAHLTAAYGGQGIGDELDRLFHAKVEPMLEALDAKLVAKLGEVGASTDAAGRSRAVTEAQAIIAGTEAYLANEPLIAQLDANPVTPLTIERTLTASLEVLNRTLSTVIERSAI